MYRCRTGQIWSCIIDVSKLFRIFFDIIPSIFYIILLLSKQIKYFLLCRHRIFCRSWQIPADASKPADKRIRSGSYRKNQRSSCLPLPIGVSDFRLAQAEYYYVDKTMMIKDFIDERPMVTLFTRPRRFGKTLNMDMLHFCKVPLLSAL